MKPFLRGNYTAYKSDPGLKLSLQDYLLVNGEWQQTFRINGMSCRGRFVAMMGRIFDIKFDKKTCSVPKGVYVFNNVDYDFVDHVFMLTRDYGRVLRKVTVFSNTGTSVCLEFEAVVTAKT
ncbi:uncharacterized protein LOC125236555 [Leguminivora glycinivorella]|uniref:uncharacterized protein LOC125236555 n=1 Tax=Leguminivora glycinivorella TaxID=1035111 RepID=UPI00200D9F4C|nr:uncharacterized protein LOC125236555 [Leguminivora glycinivorella]